MGVPSRYILHQGPVLGALARAVAASVRLAAEDKPAAAIHGAPTTPPPELTRAIRPRSAALVGCYVRHVGGDATAYRASVPPHLFPQWGFPLAGKLLTGLGFPLLRVLNAGCRLELNAPLPAGEPLRVRARLQRVDANSRRALICTRIVTGAAAAPDAVVSELYSLIPLARGAQNERKPPRRVPAGCRELAVWRLGAGAGLEFAKLTGDFNPIHWVPPYARAAGFRTICLHGFSTLARTYEGLVRHLLCGDASGLASLDVQFASPLLLPAQVGLYIRDTDVFVGDGPGGRAYLHGRFWLQTPDRARCGDARAADGEGSP